MAKEEKSPTKTEEAAVDGANSDVQALKCELKKKEISETTDSVSDAVKEEAKNGAKEEKAKNGESKEAEAKNGTAEDDKSSEKVNGGGPDQPDNKTEEKYHESPTKNEAYILLAQGKRNYLVKDYSSAVATLGECCAKFSEIFGELADECGDVYFSYGKALLELAREESGVLGSAIEKDKEEGSENDEEDDEEEDGEEEGEEKEKEEAEEGKETETETAKVKENGADAKESDADAKEKKENGESSENDKPEEEGTKEEEGAAAEEDVNNLQLAWEMLELAKIIYERQKSEEKLADTLSKLGEVSLETENYEQAIEDMSKSLEIQQKILSADNRGVAETYFQLGVACSLANFHDRSISYFKKAKEVLELRIKNLKTKTEPDAEDKNDAFYTIDGEVKEIEAILPEIDEKIADMEDFKAETLKALTASIMPSKPKDGESSSSSASASASDSSASKPVSDISHLIRKKRKPEEGAEGSECKIKRTAAEPEKVDGEQNKEEPKVDVEMKETVPKTDAETKEVDSKTDAESKEVDPKTDAEMKEVDPKTA